MKVTTDGCLFGAIVANEISDKEHCRVLDIGAGTGLLSLMVAQENENAVMDAVEIDSSAAQQARDNIAASPWADKIAVVETDVLQYEPSLRYDFILSNPPFYEQQLGSPVAGRQMAHHSSKLILQQLFKHIAKLLKQDGQSYILLPFYRWKEAIALALESGLFVSRQWQIRQTPKHSFFRTVFCFGHTNTEIPVAEEIIIRDETGTYTASFKKLLRPFYLHL